MDRSELKSVVALRCRWRRTDLTGLAGRSSPHIQRVNWEGGLFRWREGRAMKLPEPMSWDRAEARKGRFDGKFIIGVMTTGIYCLPSCAARPPKPQNVRLFTTEAEAKAAGLRACKRCRPDLYYKGEDENVSLFQGLAERVAAAPESFADAPALAKEAGVSLTKLGDL